MLNDCGGGEEGRCMKELPEATEDYTVGIEHWNDLEDVFAAKIDCFLARRTKEVKQSFHQERGDGLAWMLSSYDESDLLVAVTALTELSLLLIFLGQATRDC